MPGLLLLIALSVSLLAMGGTTPATQALAIGAATVAAAVTAEWAMRRRPEAPVRLPLAWALGIAAAVALAQTVPLPPAIGALLAPASHRVWTSEPFDPRAWHPLSIAPAASLARAAVFAAAALVHIASAWWIGAGRRQGLAAGALAALVTGVCAAALAERTGGPAIWIARFSQPEQALGPFPNRNDLGVLAAAAVPFAAAAFLAPLSRIARRARTSAEGWGAALRGGPDSAIAAAFAGALAILAATVFVSGSQSALVALGAALAVALALFVLAPRVSTAQRGTAAAMILAVLVIAGWTSSRAGNTPDLAPIAGDLSVRAPLWERTTEIAKTFPVTGAGAGAIDAALQLHPFPASPERAFRAENDLLETAAELGFPAVLVIVFLVVAWLARAFSACAQPGDTGRAAIASTASFAAIATGALGTFVVSVPALLLFAAAGCACGVPPPQGTAEGHRAANPARRRRLAAVLACGVLTLPLLWLSRDEGALAAAREAESIALESPQPWSDAAEQLAAAERWYERRLRSRPTDAYARLGLAALLETRARDPNLTSENAAAMRARADALCAAARDMDPGDPAVARYRIR